MLRQFKDKQHNKYNYILITLWLTLSKTTLLINIDNILVFLKYQKISFPNLAPSLKLPWLKNVKRKFAILITSESLTWHSLVLLQHQIQEYEKKNKNKKTKNKKQKKPKKTQRKLENVHEKLEFRFIPDTSELNFQLFRV